MQDIQLRNKQLLESSFKLWVQNVVMDDLDDSIAALVGNELVSPSAVQQAFGEKRKGGGSVPGEKTNIDCGMQDGARQFFNAFFSAIMIFEESNGIKIYDCRHGRTGRIRFA